VYAIGFYLLTIYEEAVERGYRYTQEKILKPADKVQPIPVTTGQVRYEWSILKERLRSRSPPTYDALLRLEQRTLHPSPHPLFVLVKGNVEPWEKAYWRRKQPSAE
jgi:hypothetical protein